MGARERGLIALFSSMVWNAREVYGLLGDEICVC